MFHPSRHRRRSSAFTVLELVTVSLVVAILVVMFLPVVAGVQRRVEKTKCSANLRALHVAANLYVQDHRQWPQVVTKDVDPLIVTNKWLEILQPYHIDQKNWLCPTTQKVLNNPDFSDPDNARLDYTAFPFDTNPQTPFRWSNMPWFVERADMHGAGQLMIFSDGHISELGEYAATLKQGGGATAPPK